MKNQPTFAVMKNRFIFDSYKPMHLISSKNKDGSTKYRIDLK